MTSQEYIDAMNLARIRSGMAVLRAIAPDGPFAAELMETMADINRGLRQAETLLMRAITTKGL